MGGRLVLDLRVNCGWKRSKGAPTLHKRRNRGGERGGNVNNIESPNTLFLFAHNIMAHKQSFGPKRPRSTTSYLVTWKSS